MEETLKVLDSCLSTIKWRLKSSSKHRLQIDILALCTGLRSVIMVDYGGKMPELQEHLCALLKLCQQESRIFEHLRVMVIEDMIYLIHVEGLAELVSSSLNSEAELQFVDLEHDPPKMISLTEKSSLGMQLKSVQKLFLSFFPLSGVDSDLMLCNRTDHTVNAKSPDVPIASQSSEYIDLSSCMNGTQVTVPTLNGWLLGYPVVYLFSKEHIADAIYNLSTKSLRIFRILVCRNGSTYKGSPPEELMRIATEIDRVLLVNAKRRKISLPKLYGLLNLTKSGFSVPYDLSMGGSNEPWAEMFMAQLQSKWGKCKQTWRTLQMEVSECYPQAIAL